MLVIRYHLVVQIWAINCCKSASLWRKLPFLRPGHFLMAFLWRSCLSKPAILKLIDLDWSKVEDYYSYIQKSQIIHKTSNWHQSIALFLCFRGIWGIHGVSGMTCCSRQNKCCHQVGNASGQVGSFSASENSLKHSERNYSKCYIYHYHHILILIMFTLCRVEY